MPEPADAVLGLASASPRRRELLQQIGLRFRLVAVEVDETPREGEPAESYVLRVAAEKANAGFAAIGGALPVLGADTAVVLDGTPLGKPRDGDDARRMLGSLGGREHMVLSAVALVHAGGTRTQLSRSRVRMRALHTAEVAAYVASGEPMDKAGAYAIQGRAAVFVEHLEGSYSGVMGLPLFETAALLGELGIDVLHTA